MTRNGALSDNYFESKYSPQYDPRSYQWEYDMLLISCIGKSSAIHQETTDNPTGDVQLLCKLFCSEKHIHHYSTEDNRVNLANTPFCILPSTPFEPVEPGSVELPDKSSDVKSLTSPAALHADHSQPIRLDAVLPTFPVGPGTYTQDEIQAAEALYFLTTSACKPRSRAEQELTVFPWGGMKQYAV